MKTLSVLKRAFLLILCVTMLLCVASCKNAEKTPDFGPEMNDIEVGKNDAAADIENNDSGNTAQPDEKPDADSKPDEKPDADSKPDEKPDADSKPDEKEDLKNDPEKKPANCNHSWKNATCDAPKTCSKCGATEGEAVGHKWKAAGCDAPKTCTVCKATEGEVAHKYKSGLCSCGAREWGRDAWHYVKVQDQILYVTTLDFDKKEVSYYEYHSPEYYEKDEVENPDNEEDADKNDKDVPTFTHQGVKYLQYDGVRDPVTYNISGETITVQLLGGTFTMSKSGKTKATVTAANGVEDYNIVVGATFEYEK